MATASSPVNISVFPSPENKPMPCSAVTSASSAKCSAHTARTAFSLPPLPIMSVMVPSWGTPTTRKAVSFKR